ncbi:MAG: IS630 family transposase [Gemmatimonadaceae bacterium]
MANEPATRPRRGPTCTCRAERHGFEYIRHGTLSFYAALNTKTGVVFGQTAERHTSQAFIAFLAELLSTIPARQEVHIICDNLSAHRTKQVEAFVAEHPRLHLHFTATYSSWLNQVELWFAKIERALIHRGVFLSVKDLGRRIMKYIRLYNNDPRPIRWKYSDPTHRIHVA